MPEGGAWILILEGLVVGAFMIGLIAWAVSGTSKRDQQKMRDAEQNKDLKPPQ